MKTDFPSVDAWPARRDSNRRTGFFRFFWLLPAWERCSLTRWIRPNFPRNLPRLGLLLVGALLLTACGGGGGSVFSQAIAQAAPQQEVARLHFVLRPDAAGRWFIQDDVDHKSVGVGLVVEQFPDRLRVNFLRSYTHAGVIQITSDDDFRDRVGGYANLGLNATEIRIVAGGQVIDPATVYNHVALTPGQAGNLWVSVTMVNQ